MSLNIFLILLEGSDMREPCRWALALGQTLMKIKYVYTKGSDIVWY